MRDLAHNISAVPALQPAARTASANGTAIDLQGVGAVAVAVSFGAWTDGTHTPKLQESEDGATGWAEVAPVDLAGSFTPVSSAAGQNAVQQVGYIGYKWFIRPVMTVAGASTGAISAAMAIRSNLASAPA